MVRRLASAGVVWAVAMGLASGGGQPGVVGPEIATGVEVEFRVEVVATGLEVPWSIDFLPDGRLVVTERPGRVRMIEADGRLLGTPVYTVPGVAVSPGGEIGLMDLVLHPGFAQNGLVYLSFGFADGSGGEDVRVVRYRFVPREPAPGGPDVPREMLVEDRVILAGIPAAANHAGCRMAFGPDGKLYITTGDGLDREMAQDLGSLGGKTLRVNDDGTVPGDNPFVGVAGARGEVWSLGHRNAQGIAFQPGTGVMFQTEHGPSGFDGPGGGDELNIVERGKNYGWPVIHHRIAAAGLERPQGEWTPAIAPASAAFSEGGAFPGLAGDFLFGALRGEAVWRVELGQDGRTIVRERRFVTGLGRIRDVVVAPDGLVYFSTSNRDGRGTVRAGDDKVLRLVPVGR